MKKLLLIILLVGIHILSFGQLKIRDANQLLKEMKWFIDTVNNYHISNKSANNQYIVYALYVYKNTNLDSGICITMGYILNSNDSRYILPTHYIKLGDEYILVRLDNKIVSSDLEGIELIKFNTYQDDAVKIIQKLYPSAIGGFTYYTPGVIFCWDKNKMERKYYENADEIPMDKSIWAIIPK